MVIPSNALGINDKVIDALTATSRGGSSSMGHSSGTSTTPSSRGGPSAESPAFGQRQQIIQHAKLSLLYTAMDVKWIPQSAMMVVVGQHPNNNGACCLYQLSRGEIETKLELRFSVPFKCCTVAHNYCATIPGSTSSEGGGDPFMMGNTSVVGNPSIAIGDFIGGLRVWDTERLLQLPQKFPSIQAPQHRVVMEEAHMEGVQIFKVPRAHDSIINAIDGARYSGPPELVTGSRDGAVKVWDIRQPQKPVVALEPVDKSSARDCWAVRFGNSYDPDERVVAAGYDNGDVKLFDLRTQKMVHEMNVGNGVCDVEFDRPDIRMNKLSVAMLEGRVRVSDLRTLHPKLGYAYVEQRVSDGTIWSTKSVPQNREVFLSGGGGDLTLCQYKYPPERMLKDTDGIQRGIPGAIEQLNQAKIGDQPINAIDWNKSKEGLVACTSFDQCLRIMLVTKLNLLR